MMYHLSMAFEQPSLSAEHKAIDDVLWHIEQSLSAFLRLADQMVSASFHRQAVPLMLERIGSYARRVEESMRVLRDFEIARTGAATELSQSLTVIVLVADMVVSGHLAPTSLDDEMLFRRNVGRAQASLKQLRAHPFY